MLTKDQAICIRAIDYSETSQILTFFSRENGKIDAIAKGAKRPKSSFGGPIEVLSYGGIVFSHKADVKLATLTEYSAAVPFMHLSSDLVILNCALFAAELVNLLTTEYDPHPGLYDRFLEFLSSLQEPDETLVLLIIFQLSLLKEVGLQPILSSCSNCKSSPQDNFWEVYFSSEANGLICRDCQAAFPDRLRLPANVAKVLTNLKLIVEADERTIRQVEVFLVRHFTDILHRPPKMARHVLRW
jgi:DNA repair protein RecO (recombination protein O)